MKKTFFLFVGLGISNLINAQSSSEISKIALSVVMPDNLEGMEVSSLSKLQTKITQIVTSSGLAADGYNHNFVIYPKFSIYESRLVEGGLQDMNMINCELSLFIKQVDNNLIYSTISKSLNGYGKNKQLAIVNALSKINTAEIDYQLFIETGKNKIVKYYTENCNDILAKSEGLVKRQEYEQALGLLLSVPEEVSCYKKAIDRSIEAYKVYQNHKCNEIIQEAKTEIAANDLTGALSSLKKIDPSTPCFKESQTLILNAANKFDSEAKKQWDFQMKIYNDEVSLEKQRINAIKEIAVSYFKSQPTTLNYNYIIK